VENAANTLEAWNALAALYQQRSSANVLRLKREMATLEKKRDESITKFMSRVSNLREQIQTATGNDVPDADVICAVLSALPSRYSMLKTVIETMAALPSLADVTAKLLMVEAEQTKGNDYANYNNTYQPRPFGGARPQVYVPPHRRQANRFRGRSDNNQRPNWRKNRVNGTRETRTCFYCNKPGHIKEDCRKLKADNARRDGNTGVPAVIALFNKVITTTGSNATNTEDTTGYTENDIMESYSSTTDYELLGADNRRYTGQYPNSMKCDFDKDNPVNTWFIDSASTRHITGYKHILHNYRPLDEERTVTYGNKDTVDVTTCGDVILERSLSPNLKLVMKDVLYSPANGFNLLSVSEATDNGVEFYFTKERCMAYKDGELIFGAMRYSDRLYKLASPPILPKKTIGGITTNLTAATDDKKDKDKGKDGESDPQLWHRRLGHIGYSSLKKMMNKGMVEGLPVTAEDVEAAKEICDVCNKTKLTRLPFPASTTKTTAPLELIHMDLCGPMEESLGKSKYMATFLDDYSGYSAVVLLKYKSDVYQAIVDTFALFETQLAQKIKSVRTDNGGEYTSNKLEDYFKSKGIEHQTTMADTL
jgi:hypothetical protein